MTGPTLCPRCFGIGECWNATEATCVRCEPIDDVMVQTIVLEAALR